MTSGERESLVLAIVFVTQRLHGVEPSEFGAALSNAMIETFGHAASDRFGAALDGLDSAYEALEARVAPLLLETAGHAEHDELAAEDDESDEALDREELEPDDDEPTRYRGDDRLALPFSPTPWRRFA